MGRGARYRAGVQADGLNACPAGHPLVIQDLDLDGPRVGAVDASGTLGYVTDPHHAVDAIGEALADLSAETRNTL